MAKSEYQKKLLDPRWQKKRLQILERDAWACQSCGDAESTLHIHHRYYKGQPWEVPDTALVTLCESCHSEESASLKAEQKLLLETLADLGVDSCGFSELAIMFHEMKGRGLSLCDPNLSVLVHAIKGLSKDGEAWEKARDAYFYWLANKGKKSA